jgi:hypothetical protein
VLELRELEPISLRLGLTLPDLAEMPPREWADR